ncbi:MAG: septum formation initiator family protein [Anaerolineae bacterium]|nr:septum formation initiator family protein [Anaerolineae bacterium]
MFFYGRPAQVWHGANFPAIIGSMAEHSPSPNPQRSGQLSGLQILFASILAIGLLLGINFSSRITAGQHIQRDRTVLEMEIATLEAEQVMLQAELDYARSDEYVAAWARAEGKMVMQNEVLIIPVPAGSPLPTATPSHPVVDLFEPETQLVENWQLWWALFFDSEPPF